VKLTTHPHLVQGSRMSNSYKSPLPLPLPHGSSETAFSIHITSTVNDECTKCGYKMRNSKHLNDVHVLSLLLNGTVKAQS
jgi:hypothetical protein